MSAIINVELVHSESNYFMGIVQKNIVIPFVQGFSEVISSKSFSPYYPEIKIANIENIEKYSLTVDSYQNTNILKENQNQVILPAIYIKINNVEEKLVFTNIEKATIFLWCLKQELDDFYGNYESYVSTLK